MAKLKTYTVYAKCEREVGLTVRAESLEEAIVKAKELDEDDFVEVIGDYLDGSTTISGIHLA